MKSLEWSVILKLPSRTNEILLGARWAHFEVMLHGGPPEWRLKVVGNRTLSE
jgi:hypothetical protein